MSSSKDSRAAEHRKHADFARRRAAAAADPEMRRQWLDIAREYDALAVLVEREIRRNP
jgi:hypothetical protein